MSNDTNLAVLPGDWEMVIGLEAHVELATKTKLFCGCPNTFGAEPNTNVCPGCLGLPGGLPVVNQQAVTYAMRLGRALHCDVNPSVFARKNYFYPDMSSNYQTSQFDKPTNTEGWLELADGRRAGIERAHIEEDTGKTTHVGGGGRIHDAEHSLVDYNRCGVPLVEIVGKADLRTAEEARQYVTELRAIILAVEVSDAKMEEGSMRVDANVSVRKPGEPFGVRCEIKNLNSLRSLVRAINYEARRQVDVLEAGGKLHQETRHWDEEQGRTNAMRSKETAADYRYFPDPDLLPLVPNEAEIAAIDAAMPPLPATRREAVAEAGGSREIAALMVEKGLDETAVAAITQGAAPDRVFTHLEHNVHADSASALNPNDFAALVNLESSGALTATQAKQVLAEMLETGKNPTDIAKTRGFEAMDEGTLEALVDEAIASDNAAWEKFKAGDTKVAGVFVGYLMKATKGQADGKAVTAILRSKAGF